MRLVGRTVAFILGLIGCAIAIVLALLYSGYHRAVGMTGVDATQTHGLIGFFLVLVGLIGSILVFFSPIVAAILLLIAGIGLFFVVKGFALISVLFFIVAAVLALTTRSPRKVGPGVPKPSA